MAASNFVHLHLHTQYSFLDGAIRIDDLVQKAVEYGMPAVAMTDHGNMFGAVQFYKKAKAKGIKPIVGCEVYVAVEGMEKRHKRDNAHLVLLAKNKIGYQNLCYMVSKSWLEGFYYEPRIDKDLLREHSEGLIALSACLGGELPSAIRNGGVDAGRQVAAEYLDIMGEGNYYLEIMRNGFPQLEGVNKALVQIGQELNIPIVATNDCHYMDRDDAYAQEALMAISTGKTLDDQNRLRHDTDELFFKPPQLMHEQFSDLPQSLENSLLIADQCDLDLELGQVFLPQFPVPSGYDLSSYLREKAAEGLQWRLKEAADAGKVLDADRYGERLGLELDTIISMGFPGYFLIVWDFIRHAREQAIPVGPGRGSGAGSLVAYVLGITDLDPIPYGLLFERFLNPERVSMPDFDIDFCMNRRDEVIRYVAQKYGKDNVGQIATFAVLKAKSVIRDVGRVMGLPYGEVDAIAKLVPPGLGVDLAESMKDSRFREKVESEETYRNLMRIAQRLEGLNRQAGMHAAGIVIADKPLWEYTPLFRGQDDEVITQYAKEEVEDVGLIKFDFLGLTTLTVIDVALGHINRSRRAKGEPDLRIDRIPLKDKDTYKMISAGDTTGVFQLESSGFTDLVRRFKPDRFEDIVALVALFRPGPIGAGMVDDFVDRKHGRKRVEYPHPSLCEILEETYGTIIYQEQVMQVARKLAGFSLGQADLLRRAMGKKKDDVMAKQRHAFVEGASQTGIVDAEKAAGIFDLLAEFAKYGFNKSHSAAYALVSYQTAWLKCHYPVEFMAALLSAEKSNTDKVVRYINEARARGVVVLPPDVNESDVDFRVIDGNIRFGMGAIKGIGEALVAAVLEARQEASFTSIYDFCDRVDLRKVNKKALEVLVKCGAFDTTNIPRSRILGALERAIDNGQRRAEERNSPQLGLFGLMADSAPESMDMGPDFYPDVADWPFRQRLAFEKEFLGFYVTGHPLDRFRSDLERLGVTSSARLADCSEGSTVTLAGVITGLRERPSRRGNGRNAFAVLEDLAGKVEILLFGDVYEESEAHLKSDQPVTITGQLLVEGEERVDCKVRVRSVQLLSELVCERTSRVSLRVDTAQFGEEVVDEIRRLVGEFPGSCSLWLRLVIPDKSEIILSTASEFGVHPSEDFVEKAEKLLGDGAVVMA